ncbi:MAG: protein kinase [Leptolyngbyaceae cyanobacterium RU_5_1]|nr:protein kinase [Leptolyngbyaceae cyanobacterium RU_5_1]
MRPPLPIGTILQNRYRVLNILGQGGFGRTYLAEDQNRFNERCALKELAPAQGSAYALDKSKELFQREAETLYQIQHPQIPRFLAWFEQDQRLFLVQEYVEGQTYRSLLDERRAQGIAFSEAEVLQLMRQILSVLAHIHSKGIIHRDIAPDNIILRQQDNKPVLIDFGVVKELATRFQAMGTTFTQPTTVGKPGYAPNEQMQTGKAYPSSDLYSLAVTAVVLMTGREPQELFDDATMTWYWQRWVTVNPGFAQVLNRMLHYRPGDRYQSVSEVVQAIQAATVGSPVQPVPAAPSSTPGSVPLPQSQPTPPQRSGMQTVAVGRRRATESAPSSAAANRRTASPTIEEPRSSLWDDPLAIIATGIGLVVLTGLGSWLIMRALLNSPPSIPTASPTVTESPTVSPSPSPTVSVTPTPKPPEPIEYTKRLTVDLNNSVVQRGDLKSNEAIAYIVNAGQGETLEATINGENVLMTVLAPDGKPIDDRAERVSYWRGTLPYNGDYLLKLQPTSGADRGRYELEVSLKSAPEPSPSPTESPSPEPPAPPGVEEIIVTFPSGQTSQTYNDRIRRNVVKRYVVTADEGSQLTAQVWGGTGLRVYSPSGQIVSADRATYWQAQITAFGQYQPGAYRIDVIGSRGTDYTLETSLQDLN